MIKRLRELFSIAALTLTICPTFLVPFIFLIGPSFLEIVELKTRDLRLRSRATIKAGDGAKVIAFDVGFLEQDETTISPLSSNLSLRLRYEACN